MPVISTDISSGAGQSDVLIQPRVRAPIGWQRGCVLSSCGSELARGADENSQSPDREQARCHRLLLSMDIVRC